jgi:hypothetical protein
VKVLPIDLKPLKNKIKHLILIFSVLFFAKNGNAHTEKGKRNDSYSEPGYRLALEYAIFLNKSID